MRWLSVVFLLACRPISSMPPPTSVGEGYEWGGNVSTGAQLIQDPTFEEEPIEPVVGIEGWAMVDWKVDFALLTYIDSRQGSNIDLYAGGGGLLRIPFYAKENGFIGMDLSGGWLWGAFGIPFSYQIKDGFWVYTNPGACIDIDPVGFELLEPRLPIGFAWNQPSGNSLYGEISLYSSGYFDVPTLSDISYLEHHLSGVYLSIGYAKRRSFHK